MVNHINWGKLFGDPFPPQDQEKLTPDFFGEIFQRLDSIEETQNHIIDVLRKMNNLELRREMEAELKRRQPNRRGCI
jgi:hypothetical protein